MCLLFVAVALRYNSSCQCTGAAVSIGILFDKVDMSCFLAEGMYFFHFDGRSGSEVRYSGNCGKTVFSSRRDGLGMVF